ncbi:Smr/MutS family protein [Acetobacteraceae bacterium H6797]|nr:Smr/MutS family protein [Acetobacteraceae bacterium H6797]
MLSDEEVLAYWQALASPLKRKAGGKGFVVRKGSNSPVGSATPASRRRAAQGLSEGEQALWHAFVATITPLPGKTLPEGSVPPPPPLPAPAPPSAAAVMPRPVSSIELQVGVAPGGLDGKRWKELRRGRTKPERKLDLHGKRVQEAHTAVRRFLHDAVADGLRCVVIVTGKGSTAEGGILRREFPHWLNSPELRPLILGAAHPHAANPGAVHLLLRKRK